MKTKKEYNLEDAAWIHLGNGKLHKGVIVDIFDLAHAGWSKDIEFYIVQVPTEIEPLLEVRTWEQISQDAKGPIGCYRTMNEVNHAETRFLGKVGITLPEAAVNHTQEFEDVYDPTPEEVNAAIERAELAKKEMYTSGAVAPKPKRRNFPPKGKPNARKPRPTTL